MSAWNVFVKKHKDVLTLVACLALYVALTYLLHIPCPVKAITGISCPGCGMSRALISMLTLDMSAAFYYHPLVFFVIPVLVALIVLFERRMPRARKVLTVLCVVALLAVYVYRMVIDPSPVLVFSPQNSGIVWLWTRVVSLFG